LISSGAGRQHVRANEKPGAVTRPGFLRNSRGYLFILESRYIVNIFFPIFSLERVFLAGFSSGQIIGKLLCYKKDYSEWRCTKQLQTKCSLRI
jgi:hypothetical protein